MRLLGRKAKTAVTGDSGSAGSSGDRSGSRGRSGHRIRRLLSALLLIGLIAAFTKPGRRATRGAARWVDSRVEGFGESESSTYARIVAPVLGRLYQRVAADVAAELKSARTNRRLTIVDVGCGTGELVVAISQRLHQARIVGLDLSSSMLLWANRHATTDGRIRFMAGDATNLPFDDESVDLVVSTLSLHHWADPAAVFAEMDRVLKPGGVGLVYDLGLVSLDAGELRRVGEEAGLDPSQLRVGRAGGVVLGPLFSKIRLVDPEA